MTWTPRRSAYVFLRALSPILNFTMGLMVGSREYALAGVCLVAFLVNQMAVDWLFWTESDFTHKETRKRLEAKIGGK